MPSQRVRLIPHCGYLNDLGVDHRIEIDDQNLIEQMMS